MDNKELKIAIEEAKIDKRCFDMMIHKEHDECTECGRPNKNFAVFCQDHDEYKKHGLSDDSHLVCVVCLLKALSMMKSEI